ncbi:MAG: hypothetical protein GF370_02755 [Candidatus Nealsonbacteria bacterium]|nr:hypothetical protein [Candidatus Nealsonbacteria bacterium]
MNQIEEKLVERFVREAKKNCNCTEKDFFYHIEKDGETIKKEKKNGGILAIQQQQVPEKTHLLWAKYSNFKNK